MDGWTYSDVAFSISRKGNSARWWVFKTINYGGITQIKMYGTSSWKGMKKDVAYFVAKCTICYQVKVEHQKIDKLFQPFSILEWKWDNIIMDFIEALPHTSQGHDFIWVIFYSHTKSAYLPLNKSWYSINVLSKLYFQELDVIRILIVAYSIHLGYMYRLYTCILGICPYICFRLWLQAS